jgi:hypothetical protein
MRKLKKITYSYKILEQANEWNPREWSNITTLYCKHRNYTLGDHQIEGDFDSYEELKQSIVGEDKDVILTKPLFFYDHGNIKLETSRSCKWDSGSVGILVVKKKDVIEALGNDYTIEQINEVIQQELENYNSYLNGDIESYEYRIIGTDGYEDISEMFFTSEEEAKKACLIELARLNEEENNRNDLIEKVKEKCLAFLDKLQDHELKKDFQNNLVENIFKII